MENTEQLQYPPHMWSACLSVCLSACLSECLVSFILADVHPFSLCAFPVPVVSGELGWPSVAV